MEKLCDDEGLGIKFEFTARDSPRQNGKVERMFATLWGRCLTNFRSAGIPKELRDKVWAEMANYCTHMQSVLCDKKGQSSHFKFYGKEPKWINNLHQFGEVCVVHKGLDLVSKLQDKGFIGMMAGYSNKHGGDTFRIIRLSNLRVYTTRDVRWLKMSYGLYMKKKKNGDLAPDDLSDDESDDEDSLLEDSEPNQAKPVHPGSKVTVKVEPVEEVKSEGARAEIFSPPPKLTRQLPRIYPKTQFHVETVVDDDKSDQQDILTDTVEEEAEKPASRTSLGGIDILQRLEELERTCDYVCMTKEAFDNMQPEPVNYKAMRQRSKLEQQKWESGMSKEFTNLHKRLVWGFPMPLILCPKICD